MQGLSIHNWDFRLADVSGYPCCRCGRQVRFGSGMYVKSERPGEAFYLHEHCRKAMCREALMGKRPKMGMRNKKRPGDVR